MKKILFTCICIIVSSSIWANVDPFSTIEDKGNLGILTSITILDSDLSGSGEVSYSINSATEDVTGTCMGPGRPHISNHIGSTFDITFNKRALRLDLGFDLDPLPSFTDNYEVYVYVRKWWDRESMQYVYFPYNSSDGINTNHNYIQCYYIVNLFVNYH